MDFRRVRRDHATSSITARVWRGCPTRSWGSTSQRISPDRPTQRKWQRKPISDCISQNFQEKPKGTKAAAKLSTIILAFYTTAWYAGSSAGNKKGLDYKFCSRNVGCSLATSDQLVSAILRDPAHPEHHLFDPLPSGRHYSSTEARVSRLTHSFCPLAERKLNL